MHQKPPIQKFDIIYQAQEWVKDLIELEDKLKQLLEHYKMKTIVDGLTGKITIYNND